MICNYHTHTVRCHHAEGEDREYIEAAIAHGIKKLGFSDHIPFDFPDGFRSDYRVSTEDVGDYFLSLRALREEYRGRIGILIGFEMEYYPKYFDKMYENALRWGAEYLILGQHFTRSEHPYGFYCGCATSDPAELECFVNDTVSGIESGVFSYVAHPDLIHFVGDEDLYAREMRRICVAAREHGMPLEINLLGIRGGRCYPAFRFWRIAGEEGCLAVLGADAHRPCDVADRDSEDVARALAYECGVEILEDPDIVYGR